jgi:hypothetical protein
MFKTASRKIGAKWNKTSSKYNAPKTITKISEVVYVRTKHGVKRREVKDHD